MAYQTRTGPFDKVTLPTAVNGTDSRTFTVPQGATAVTLTIPTLVSGATLKVQSLQPKDNDQQADAWTDIKYTSALAALTFVALAGLTSATTITLPAYLLGGGACKFVASAAQTGAADALTVYLDWAITP